MFPAPIAWLRSERLWKRLAGERAPHAIIFPSSSPPYNIKSPFRRGETLQSCLRIRLKKNMQVHKFPDSCGPGQHVHDKYRTFAHLLEVGLWLRKSSWLRTCRDLILLLFLLGIHEVEVCYPLLSLLEHWCQHLCLVNPDRGNRTKFKINSGESWVWVT